MAENQTTTRFEGNKLVVETGTETEEFEAEFLVAVSTTPVPLSLSHLTKCVCVRKNFRSRNEISVICMHDEHTTNQDRNG